MYCRNCGEKLNDNDRVCPACGTPVDAGFGGNGAGSSASSQTYAQGAPHNGPQTYSYSKERSTADQQPYQYSGPDYQASDDSGSAGWGFLGCCFPLIGLILFLVWKDNKPRSAKSAGVGAIIGVVLVIVAIAILFALGIGLSYFGLSQGEWDISGLEEFLEENTKTIVNTLNI